MTDQAGTPRSNSALQLEQQELVYNDYYLLTSVKKPGGISAQQWRFFAGGAPKGPATAAAHWLLYENGAAPPRRLKADHLPPPEKVWQYLIDDQSQVLMMTNKTMFRIELPTDGVE